MTYAFMIIFVESVSNGPINYCGGRLSHVKVQRCSARRFDISMRAPAYAPLSHPPFVTTRSISFSHVNKSVSVS